MTDEELQAKARELAGACVKEIAKLYDETPERYYDDKIAMIPPILTALREVAAARDAEKRAPVQGYVAGIPWSMHLRAYDAYCKMYGPQQALIEGRCRGGFSTGELDMFIPGWRDELSELTKLRDKIAALTAEVERLREAFAESIEAREGK